MTVRGGFGFAGQAVPPRPARKAAAADAGPDGEGADPCVARLRAMWPEDRADLAWDTVAHSAQRAPEGDWRTWVFLGGRGAGKTRAGAEWVWAVAEALGAGGRIALVAPTLHDARAVMVEGPSGLLNLPWREGAVFEPSMRRVRFPGGALGLMFSAEEPERLRGPQFHAAWGDEFCAWRHGGEVLAMLRLGLRLAVSGGPRSEGSAFSTRRGLAASPQDQGEEAERAEAASDRVASGSALETCHPRLLLTTTPRPGRVLRGVLGEAGCVRTDAATAANAAHLAPGFVEALTDLYGGTRRAAQELEGRLLEAEGALFTEAMLAAARAGWDGDAAVERTVVAVDPPAGTLSGRARDACGVVVAARLKGRDARGRTRAVILADRTRRGLSPEGWAGAVRRAVEDFGAGRVVVETNQGGAMAEAVLRASGVVAPIRRVHAALGKAARAEPVAALYEQGRVAHAPGLEPLEAELTGLGDDGAGGDSPDRADALVWALTELMLKNRGEGPRVTQF